MKRILNKGVIVCLFEKHIRQIIKEVGDGILDLEPNNSYVRRMCMDFNIDLGHLENK